MIELREGVSGEWAAMVQVSGKAVVAALERNGWERRPAGGGSHVRLFRKGRGLVVVPAHGNKPLPPGTLRSILDQAGLTEDELRAML